MSTRLCVSSSARNAGSVSRELSADFAQRWPYVDHVLRATEGLALGPDAAAQAVGATRSAISSLAA